MPILFISHGLESGDDAAWLKEQLRAQGLEFWQGDEQNNLARLEGLSKAEGVILLMTPLASRSARVKRELLQTLNLKKTLLPVLVKGEPFSEVQKLKSWDWRAGRKISPDDLSLLQTLLAGESAEGQKRKTDTQEMPAAEMTSLVQPKGLRDLALAMKSGPSEGLFANFPKVANPAKDE
jgi:hypothetical protein